MIDILDEMSELVYVTDMETYDLLYMNQAGKDSFQIESIEGRKCYELLQGEPAACPFCVNDKLCKDKIYTWEHFNNALHKYFLLKDKIIDFNGREAHVEIAFDITNQMKEKEQLESTLETDTFLMDCVKCLYEGNEIKETSRALLDLLNHYMLCDMTTIVLRTDETTFFHQELTYDGTYKSFDALENKSEIFKEWSSLLKTQDMIIVNDIDRLLEHCPAARKRLQNYRIDELVVVGLFKNKELNGFIIVVNPKRNDRMGMDLIYKTISYYFMISSQRWHDEKQLERLSFHDTLTGLKNRNHYASDIEKFQKEDTQVGVMYLDLNGLKDINDTFGHAKGDETLIECANTLNLIFGNYPASHLYRMGGDEFTLICVGVDEKSFMNMMAELKKQVEIYTSYKAAIGFVWSQTSRNLNNLLSEADIKMYEDKKRFYRTNLSGNRYRHYHDDVLELADVDVLMDRIENEYFSVYLQPKFSFADKSLIGAEALIRYKTPDGNPLSPSQFLPMLEDANLIGNLDFYVFEVICHHIANWVKEGRCVKPISTNFSRYSLLESDFISRLDRIVDVYGVDKALLEIEITETVEGLEWFDMVERIEAIRQAGYAISIDDFGAHYANLSLFTSIEFNVLKIDKSLIDNIVANTRAQSVVSSIVAICQDMNVHIVVEGVETMAQFDTLKQLGCEGIQGYLFSCPIPVKEFEMRYVNTL